MNLTNTERDRLVSELLCGNITLIKLNEMRSNARRYNKLDLSIFLAEVFERYKQELKSGKVEK